MRPAIRILFKNFLDGDFPGDPVVENSPLKAGDSGLISGGGSKFPHVEGQLSPSTTTREPVFH